MFMEEIYMATSNKNKYLTMKRNFDKYGIGLKQFEISLPEIQSYEVKEVIKDKINEAYNRLQKPCIVHDGGFFIPSINGFPGALVHPILDKIDIEGILKLLENKDRTCYFHECLAYYDGKNKTPMFFESKVNGTISLEPKGGKAHYHWSRLFEIFIPDGFSKTLAEMEEKEYIKWHDRDENKKYIRKFAEWYLKMI